jgi:hypothetical protein
MAKVAPWMGFMYLKRVLLIDTIPNLADTGKLYGKGLFSRLALAPQALPWVVRRLVQRLISRILGLGPAPRSDSAKKLLEQFRRDGLLPIAMTPAEVDRVRAAVEEPLNGLLRKRESAVKRSFETNQTWLGRGTSPDVYTALEAALHRTETFEVASCYLGRPVRLRDVLLQVNDSKDAFQHNKFADAGVEDSACNYMHVDTSYGMVKAAVYLSTVTEKTGPFSYSVGTNNIPVGTLEAVVRRAVDRSGLSAYTPDARRRFLALPRWMRRKCTFGSDLMDSTPESRHLLAVERKFVSTIAPAAMFDNVGIHRGALVDEGERRILFLTLA